MSLILFTHNLVINAVRQSNSVNTKSISTAINDRRSMCNSSSAAAGDGGENALGYSITGARRKCLYLHPIPVHCTPTYVTVCASVCVRMMFSLKRGKYSFHMRCNFLAHFNYANCVYVETNSHCLPAHVCLFLSLSTPPLSHSFSLSVCTIVLCKPRGDDGHDVVPLKKCASASAFPIGIRIRIRIHTRFNSPFPPSPSPPSSPFRIRIRMAINVVHAINMAGDNKQSDSRQKPMTATTSRWKWVYRQGSEGGRGMCRGVNSSENLMHAHKEKRKNSL